MSLINRMLVRIFCGGGEVLLCLSPKLMISEGIHRKAAVKVVCITGVGLRCAAMMHMLTMRSHSGMRTRRQPGNPVTCLCRGMLKDGWSGHPHYYGLERADIKFLRNIHRLYNISIFEEGVNDGQCVWFREFSPFGFLASCIPVLRGLGLQKQTVRRGRDW